jgi:hypothetical protein
VLTQGTIDILIAVGNILGKTHGEGKVRRRWVQISVDILDHCTLAEILVLNQFSDPNIAKVVYVHTSHLLKWKKT